MCLPSCLAATALPSRCQAASVALTPFPENDTMHARDAEPREEIPMPITMQIYSDFICPFCYLARGIVDRLRQEFDIHEEWLPLEIHPETPPGGALLSQHLPHIDWDELYQRLRENGRTYGITFGDVRMLPNSRKALLASEYARGAGCEEAFHRRVFQAYFTDLQDIGDEHVLCDIAAAAGCDPDRVRRSFTDPTCCDRLQQVATAAARSGIASVPTFILNGREVISGALPLDDFRQALRGLGA